MNGQIQYVFQINMIDHSDTADADDSNYGRITRIILQFFLFFHQKDWLAYLHNERFHSHGPHSSFAFFLSGAVVNKSSNPLAW